MRKIGNFLGMSGNIKRVFLLLCFALTSLFGFSNNAGSDTSLQVKKAVGFINKNVNSPAGFFMYPLLLFLKNEKNVPLKFCADSVYKYADAALFKIVKPLIALGAPDSAKAYPISQIDTDDYLTRLMYYSFNYPKVYNLKSIAYYANKLYKLGGYESTHTYFSLFILINRNRALKPGTRLKYMLDYSRKETISLTKSKNTATDLRIEAIAMLSEEDIGFISSDDIDFILSSQNDDGSWCNTVAEGEQNKMHSTVLALWALTNWLNKH